ncbi:MAG: hypothetical protein BAA01_11585 [Bacillus thermozeamaize]|uniref:Uncharacterized protein n=1 Tax=Bacillus thermozeamaize TaxID=230954 RepID=A0A1Y3PH30_9BACI|nr:MAG: hypothetical protein BAA01_11585 [Bacillus thermozeamaize]
MKALFIYNPHSTPERNIIERAQNEMPGYLEIVSVFDLPAPLKRLVRATPALIPVTDDLQGEGLLGEGVDGKLLATAMLYKRLEEEEAAIHQAETHRLDNFVNGEKAAAQDELLMDLLNREVL